MLNRDESLRRLSYIEGHLKGIRKMLEDDAYCVDVLKQTYAVRRAIDKLDELLLKGHLSHCVPEGMAKGRAEQVVSELEALFALAKR